MAEQFTIKSKTLEDKVNQLLPSQGGHQTGLDLSASSMIIPIVDLTESAEGSNQRVDLQTSLSFNSCTAYDVQNTTTTIINTTGYFRLFGQINCNGNSSSGSQALFKVNDGTSDKTLMMRGFSATNSTGLVASVPYDFIVLLEAGHSVSVQATNATTRIVGVSRQIADLQGNLINP